MKNKKILITGSNGFIGNYFYQKYKKYYTISTFSFLNDNFNKIQLNNIETIIHCSGLAHQMNGASQELYKKVNVDQTIQLAKKAKENGIKHFIFLSTIKVYGEETDIPYSENSNCNPKDDYSISKLTAEKKLMEVEDSKFLVSIIRTPLVYGYNVKGNLKQLMEVIEKFPVIPLNNIKNKRTMVYIGNLCDTLHKIIKLEKNGVFIPADDYPLSTTQIIRMVADAKKKKIFLIQIPFLKELIKIFKPSYYNRLFKSLEIDNSYTKRELNLQKNKFSTKYGIKEMVKK